MRNALVLSEKDRQRLLELSLDLLCISGADGYFRWVNPAFTRALGWSVEELINRPYSSFAHPDDLAATTREIEKQTKAGEKALHFENRYRHKNGSWRNLEWTTVPQGDLIFAAARDVTESRLTVQQAKAIEKRLRHTLNSLDEGYMLIGFGWRFLYVNEAAAGHIRQAREALFGRTMMEMCPGIERTELFDKLRRAMDGRCALTFEASFSFADEIAGWYEFHVSPAPEGISVLSIDIAQRVRAENRLRETEALNRTIVAALSEGVVMQRADGTIDTCNESAERILGLTRDQMSGRSSLDPRWMALREDGSRFPGDQHPAMVTLRTGKPLQDVVMGVHKPDGSLIWISISAVPLFGVDSEQPHAVVTSFSDITQKKRDEVNLRRTSRALATLGQANEALIRATREDTLYHDMCRVVVETGNYRMAWIGLAENDTNRTVRPVDHAGYEDGYLDQVKITWADTERGRGPTGSAVRTGVPSINRETSINPDMAPWREEALKRGYASTIGLPLMDGSRVFGALTIHALEPDAFGSEEVELLKQLADDISYGIVALQTRTERELTAGKLERAMTGTVEAIATTVEMRDPYTAGHARRVARIAAATATEMGLDADKVHGLRLASIIHDIGKIGLPAEILTKPGKLTDLEYEIVKTHARTGYDILKQVEFPWPVAEMVHQHHERLDGSGYPNGLTGDAILLEARILAVSDVVESMISHRPYREGLGLGAALAEIRSGRGRLYDAAAVDACIKVMESQGEKFFQDAA